jgi:diguanylate cyclase (GGDEF)-like protein
MDMHTLHIEHAVLLGLYTVLTLANSLLHRGTKGVGWFPVYNLCAFIGAVLIASRGHIPNFISIIIGALFFPIAYTFLHRCVTEFFGYGSYQWQLQTALALLALAVLIRYEWFDPDTRMRLAAYSLILALQLGLSAVFVFRHLSGYMRVSGGLMGVVLALLCLNNLIRCIGTLFFGAPTNYLSGGPFLSWSLLVTSVMQGGITVAVVWMTAAVLRQDLHVLASTDSLTGLLNRRAIEVAAEREIALSQQTRKPLSAILLDLDGFKQINDSLGHRYGDDALIAVAFSLQQSMRQQDLLARLGGDEFIVLLLDTPRDIAVEIAERLRASLEDLHIVCGPHQTQVRASFGISELQQAQDWDHLVMNCDNALYEVKGMGGNLIATR